MQKFYHIDDINYFSDEQVLEIVIEVLEVFGRVLKVGLLINHYS